MDFQEKQIAALLHNQDALLIALSNCIRVLTADAVEKANSGHPGMPLGMADIMTVLAFKFLKFNPNEPKWFNRDRLVLSAGHGSMLLYTFYYLAGYKDFTIDDLQNFRQLHSKAAGHPEYGIYPAIEVTTGPLGQGLANAVGMAIAQKKYQAKLGADFCNYKIIVIVGDGCLMEGIAYEAASLAGHLKLDNLIVIFDDNGISIDGKTSLTISENHLDKFTAFGFAVDFINGHDHNQIRDGLALAYSAKLPVFIACKTIIGKGIKEKLGSEKVHGSPLGQEEIKYLKRYSYNGQYSELDNITESPVNRSDDSNDNRPDDNIDFFIPAHLKDLWANCWRRNEEDYNSWSRKYYASSPVIKEYLEPEVKITDFTVSTLIELIARNNNQGSRTEFDRTEFTPESTRASSGKIINALMQSSDKIIAGSADLAVSNNILNSCCQPINATDFAGNFIHYGVREHCMAGIMNGLAVSGFLPFGGSFLVFSDYMRPAIRLAAIMKLQLIYVMTHDSIGVGEDGPTHQPVEQLASLRAMPNLMVFRPADFTETIECYLLALQNKQGPSLLALTRQEVKQLRNYCANAANNANNDIKENSLLENQYTNNRANQCAKGAYIISEAYHPDRIIVIIFATGSEVSIALEVQKILQEQSISTRVISVPCFTILAKQEQEYWQFLKGHKQDHEQNPGPLKVAIEAGCSFGWHRIIGETGLFFGVEHFGLSAPAKRLYQYFSLEADIIAQKIIKKLPKK